MTASKYLEKDKILFIKENGDESIHPIITSPQGLKFINFRRYPVAIDVLKEVVKKVSAGEAGAGLWDISADVCPLMIELEYSGYDKSKVKEPIISINGEIFSVGCQTYTVKSAVELNKLL